MFGRFSFSCFEERSGGAILKSFIFAIQSARHPKLRVFEVEVIFILFGWSCNWCKYFGLFGFGFGVREAEIKM